MAEPQGTDADGKIESVNAYKGILRDVLDRRPSGTRQRLADALRRNRSFVTQIANPGYPTPIPAKHVATIFDVCHFSAGERSAFLDAYHKAHPRSLVAVSNRARTRHLHLVVPDFGSAAKNRAFEQLLEGLIEGAVRFHAAKGHDSE